MGKKPDKTKAVPKKGEIQEGWFFDDECEKIKLNWFLYEVALEFQSFIYDSDALAAFLKKHGGGRVAEFCAYYAKRMRTSVLDQLSGITDVTVIYEEYFTDYFQGMPRKESLALLGVAESAWDSLLSVCVACPERCLSEKERPSHFFGRYKD